MRRVSIARPRCTPERSAVAVSCERSLRRTRHPGSATADASAVCIGRPPNRPSLPCSTFLAEPLATQRERLPLSESPPPQNTFPHLRRTQGVVRRPGIDAQSPQVRRLDNSPCGVHTKLTALSCNSLREQGDEGEMNPPPSPAVALTNHLQRHRIVIRIESGDKSAERKFARNQSEAVDYSRIFVTDRYKARKNLANRREGSVAAASYLPSPRMVPPFTESVRFR